MDKQIQINANAVLKSFIADLEVIEREIDSKLKEVEKQILDNNKLTESLKVQEKEGEKCIQDKMAKVGEELKKQEAISKQMADELAKQSNITKDMEKMKILSEENLKILHIGKDEMLNELDKKKKLTLAVKSELEKQEKLMNDNIARSKKLDDEFNRINMKEAQLNQDRSKLEKDKIDFADKQNNLDLRVKNIERIEKQMKLKNG